MNDTTLLTDLIKGLPTVNASSGKSVLVADGNGVLGKVANVASAEKQTFKTLTNENLDSILDVNLTIYVAAADNTCLNKPSSVKGFTLQCCRVSTSAHYQTLMDFETENQYIRFYKGSQWMPWKRFLTTSDLTSITARISALENK